MTQTSTGESSSPLDELEGEKPSRRGRVIAISSSIVLLAIAGAYVGGVLYTSDRTPREASISGVEVGGLSAAEAVTVLDDGLAPTVTAPLTVRVGDMEAQLDPAEAGLAVDAQASVAAITGRSWDPRVVYDRLFSRSETLAVATVDTDTLTSALDAAEAFISVAPVDASIVFANGEAVVTQPSDGTGLDIEGAVTVIEESWLTSAGGDLDLPVTTLSPEYGTEAVDAAMADIVDPLLSAPVTVAAGESTATLEPATLAGLATITPADGAFALTLDADGVLEAVTAGLPDAAQVAKDATVALVDGKPSVVPAVAGTTFDAAQLASAVTTAALTPTERVATAELVEAEPEFTTADAEALGVTEVIAEFSTPLPGYADPDRTDNIQIAAGRVTGILLKPGETFSLLDPLVPFNAENGYHQSGVVENGFETKAYGGGISQLSTTLFNAAFEAGLEDVTHKPHSRWFSRYPEGREATLYEGQVDMKFTNTTDHGVLVQAWVADGRTWARLWGTKTFETVIETGGRYAFTAPETVYNTLANCVPEGGGQSGFSVDVTRVVKRIADGAEVENKTLSWTYSPWNKVICGAKPADPPAEPAGEEG